MLHVGMKGRKEWEGKEMERNEGSMTILKVKNMKEEEKRREERRRTAMWNHCRAVTEEL
jgi:hypothetical protein